MFHVPLLQPGTYSIAVNAPGFSKAVLIAGGNVERDRVQSTSSLQVAGMQTSVEVSATSPA